MTRTVIRFSFPAEMSLKAAELIVERAKKAAGSRGLFTMALSGGSTPKTLYETLAGEPFLGAMDWGKTHLFWGDERCVERDDPLANFKMARDALLKKVPLPSRNVHRIPAQIGPPGAAARVYEAELREFFEPFGGRLFDVILLGMGADGHTASLFPGHGALGETDRLVVAVQEGYGSPPVPRITLTLAAINRAECAIFLVSSAGKEELLDAILDTPDEAAALFPAAMVRPAGNIYWLIDESGS